MRIWAALAAGVFAWLALESLAGRHLHLAPRRPRLPGAVTRQVWLSQAGAAVTPRQFWAVCAATGALSGAVLWVLTRTAVVALVPAVGAGCVPWAYWSVERRRRAAARFQTWPDALRVITGGLQAGIATLHEALVELSRSGPEALRPPLSRYVRLVSRGVPEIRALEAIRAELADPVSDSVLLCLEMATREGTAVAISVLSDLTSQITGDLELAEEIRTVQTQSRIAAWAVFILPYALLVFLCATKHLYRQFYATSLGLFIVLGGAVASTVGFIIVRRLAQPVATQQRIFTPFTPEVSA